MEEEEKFGKLLGLVVLALLLVPKLEFHVLYFC